MRPTARHATTTDRIRPDRGINLPWQPGYNAGTDTWYIWDIGPEGVGFPDHILVEGTLEPGERQVFWRLVKPGGSGLADTGVSARDTVEINVEKIVWPNQDPTAGWNPNENTATWNGFSLPPGWYISSSLYEIIHGVSSHIRTEYPENTSRSLDPSRARWEGTGESYATLDLGALRGTEGWASGVTVRIELTYEFEQSPNIKVGDFVDTNHENRWEASFFANSGVKIEDRAEIQIFDTAALLKAIGGSQETINGNVVTMEGNVTEINTEHYVKLHYGTPARYSAINPADYVNSLISGIPYHWDGLSNGTYSDLDNAPKGGQTMIIDVTKDGIGEYDFEVTVVGYSSKVKYHVSGSGTPAPDILSLQSHWGSGVKFTTAKVKKL